MTTPPTLAIVGYGSIGRRHLSVVRRLLPQARIVVVRREGAPLDDGADAEVVATLDRALALRPLAAILCSPAPWHAPQGIACAEAGVHLLVEKPMATGPAEAEALRAAAARAGVVLQIGYCLRFDPALRAARQALLDGRIGRLLAIEAEVAQDLRDWRPGSDWRAGVSARAELGGGALLELSHEIDIAAWLGGDAEAVTGRLAITGLLDGLEVEDWVDLLIDFRDGARARLHMDMIQRPARRLCRLVGSEGAIEWDGIARRSRLYGRAAAEWSALFDAPVGRDTLFREQFLHFMARVADGGTPGVSGEDGRRVLDIVAAARRSSHSGQRIVL